MQANLSCITHTGFRDFFLHRSDLLGLLLAVLGVVVLLSLLTTFLATGFLGTLAVNVKQCFLRSQLEQNVNIGRIFQKSVKCNLVSESEAFTCYLVLIFTKNTIANPPVPRKFPR